MKIKVTKVFADFINKTAKETGKRFYASVVKMTEPYYRMYLGSDAVWDSYDYGDFNWKTGEHSAILVEYPESYYACPRHISTRELVEEYKRRGVKDAEGLKAMLVDMLEI